MPGTTSLIVQRTELGLPPIEFHDPRNGLRVLGPVSFGSRLQERTFAPKIPWIDFERMTHTRLTNGNYSFVVAVSGDTPAVMHSREQIVFDAFGQFEFVVTHTIDGVARSYTCYAGDMMPGDAGEIDETWHAVGIQVWKITGPHRGQTT